MTDIYEKIKNGDYETKLAYPKRPTRDCHVCSNSIVLTYKNETGVVDFCSKCGAAVKNEYAAKQEEFKVKQLAYNSDKLRLNVMFKTDALQHCGIDNYKKADKAWDMACNYVNDNKLEFIEFLEELAKLMVD